MTHTTVQNPMVETWRKINGWPYEVSNLARVRNSEKRNVITQWPGGSYKQYRRVFLWIKGKVHSFYVHRLVAENHVIGFQEGLEVNHKNGDTLNNVAENLEWVTRQENCAHQLRIGHTAKGIRNSQSKLSNDDVIAIRNDDRSLSVIADDYNVSFGLVGQIKRREIWKHLSQTI